MSSTEKQFYETNADREVSVWTDGGGLVKGRFTYVAEYSVGFVPSEDYRHLGLEKGKEALMMKGFLRIVTPGAAVESWGRDGEHKRRSRDRGSRE